MIHSDALALDIHVEYPTHESPLKGTRAQHCLGVQPYATSLLQDRAGLVV